MDELFFLGWWIVIVLCFVALLVFCDWPPERTYDHRYRILIVDKNGLDASGVPVFVKCDTCGWSTEVAYGDRYDGVPEAAAERHRKKHVREAGRSNKSAHKVGVTV